MNEVTPPSASDALLKGSTRRLGVVLACLVIGVGGLAALIGIRGAVIAPGELSVSSEVKKVQHPSGGVIAQIRVQNGSRVRFGDVLVTLDSTTASANASIVGQAVDVMIAREARLEAERDARDFAPPRAIPAAIVADERRVFLMHRAEVVGQKAQLRERQSQLRQQISGREAEIDSKKRQIELLDEELVGVRELWDKRLVPLTRLNTLERTAVELRGNVASLGADIAASRDKIAEIQLQILQVDQARQNQASQELAQLQGQLTDLRQRKVSADQDYRRITLTAPQGGVVDQLSIHTVGGVIAPGEAIMVIVPDRDQFEAKARIQRTDVDQVRPGQRAVLRFSAFNSRTTPEITGVVQLVSADAHFSENKETSFYVATILIPADQLARLKGLRLSPSMPVEAFIQTDRRTLLSYLLRPMADQLRRVFREQ